MSDNFEQINLFESVTPYFKITKPIRLIEFFAGIGSQHQALKNLGLTIDRTTIVEWQVNSIQAYNDIHIRKYDDWTQGMSKEDVAEKLFTLGVSIDHNEPVNMKSLLRKGEDWLRNVYNNIINTNNKVNISNVKAQDLEIKDTDKYDYILTYSYPCQDLSIAGKRKGMTDTSTRSGLLWEVERILQEAKELGNLPQVLLMENVPDVVSYKFVGDFRRWISRLEELGYSNYFQILNAKDYGIPQNRQRAFMVSILGDHLYKYPSKQPPTLRLKDLLEDNVDEKYYLSEALIKCFTAEDGTGDFPRRERFIQNLTRENQDIANSITTLAGQRPTDNFVGDTLELANSFKSKNKRLPKIVGKIDFDTEEPQSLDLYNMSVSDISQTLVAPNHNAQAIAVRDKILIKDSTLKGYAEAEEGDGVWVHNPHRKGGVVTKQAMPTLVTGSGDYGVVVGDLRIRKLTPKECYRLMGFKDREYELAQVNQSKTALYHQAGDSIVVNVLEAIFKEML